MQSLTQWSNLYSNESKFNIKIYSSLLPRVIFVSFAYLLVVLLVSFSFFELNPPLIQLFAVSFIVLLICILCVFSTRFIGFNPNDRHFIQEIVIQLDGHIEVEHNQYEMHVNSRVGLFGCWLVLQNSFNKKLKPDTLFIVKNSVSKQSYARLCRIINRNNLNTNH